MLRPATIRVDPGGETSFDISVRNTGTIVDEFSFEIRGDPAPWAEVEPGVLRLFPGAEGIVTVRFRPPRTPTTRGGLTPFGVKVISKEDPEGTIVEEGTLEVGEYSDNNVEMIPRTSRGRMGASHDVYIDNRGNQRVSTTIDATDPDDNLQFQISPPSTTVDPGNATRVRVRAQPKKRFLRGAPKTHPFKVIVQPEGDQALQADGTMLQEPLIPKWLIPALLALAALVLIWFFLLKPAVETAAVSAVPKNVAKNDELAAAEERMNEALAAQAAAAEKQAKALQKQIDELAGGAAAGETSDQRLDPSNEAFLDKNNFEASFTVPKGKTLKITDLVLQNPAGATGRILIIRDDLVDDAKDATLLVSALENFRDLDYHFVTAVEIGEGQNLLVRVTCDKRAGQTVAEAQSACNQAAVYYTGSLAKA
jgi:hypothetical protein